MESEHSYSGESNSDSGSSSGTSESEEETLEPVNILGYSLELPQDLCEDFGIFKEFFSLRTWQALDEKDKQHLKTFLPTFNDNDKEEKDVTVNMLFNRETFHFTSPLNTFFNNLKQGNYRPDIAKMKKFLVKARSKQQRHKIKSYYAKLLPEVLLSKERLLAAAKAAPPGPPPFLPLLPQKLSSKSHFKSPHLRARQRYFEELAAIRSEVGGEESEDENYPEGPPTLGTKKRKFNVAQSNDGNIAGTLGASDQTRSTSINCLKNILTAHRARRQYRENHPELNTSGITLDDIKQRVALVNGTKKLMFGAQKSGDCIQKVKRAPRKENNKLVNDSKPKSTKVKDLDHQSDVSDNKNIFSNVKVKYEQDSDSESSSFVDPVSSPKEIKKQHIIPDIKQESMDTSYAEDTSKVDYIRHDTENIKQEPVECGNQIMIQSRIKQPVPIKIEDLDGIDMMALPVELADDCEEVTQEDTPTDTSLTEGTMLVDADESLMEVTHANFLSLVRALFPARTAHRASRQELHARCAALMRSPIAPLNTWYSLSADWCSELDSALDFLAGEKGQHPDDFVPYLQYISESQMYQWIGAGRDCDANLGRLCDRWLRARAVPPPVSQSPPQVFGASDIPLPRFPTTWSVRPATNTELLEFRSQERRRYSSSAKPFTYTQHGYQAVVGPCARGSAACAANASLLVAERPRHVTFTALVRDAVARLPNGEGMKHDILTLLKMSQWLLPCSEQILLNAMSLALDRLNTAKRDPIIRYDQRNATYVFLFRHRSEEDWCKPSVNRARVKSATHPTTITVPTLTASAPPQAAMELEVATIEEVIENASDSDVDVEDSSHNPSAPHLSSAQLLIQATQAKLQQQIQMPTTPKQTKLTVMDAPKAKVGPPPIVSQSSPISTIKHKPKIVVNQQPIQQVQKIVKVSQSSVVTQLPKSSPCSAPKSTLIKQRPLQQKVEQPRNNTPTPVSTFSQSTPISIIHQTAPQQNMNKLVQATRSLLLRPATVQTTVTAPTPNVSSAQVAGSCRRGVVRVLSPATGSSGKSLISPRALMQQGPQPSTIIKRRPPLPCTSAVVITSQNNAITTNVVSSASVVTSSVPTRTVQLAGGRTVQLAGNQTVHLPSGQAVQLASGHTLQLSSLQLSTHSVRLPNGQTVQLASPQTVRAVNASSIKNASSQQSLPTVKTTIPTSQGTVQIPSSVQLTGQTVQIGGQSVQLAGQSVQLTGHTVKLQSGQSVQVAGQSVQMPSSGQNVQTVQLSSGQSVQTLQLTGQTVQLAGGQTVQLPSGQTLQLSSGQTVQLSSGQTIQLAGGQTVQLGSQIQTQKPVTQHVVRTQSSGEKTSQPIVAKLLTNAQGQVISLEGMVGGARTLQLAGVRPQQQKTLQAVQGVSGVRVVSATGARMARPLLLTSGKPLHNIILQQGDGAVSRVTSSGNVTPTQTIVLSSLGGQGSGGATTSSSTPLLKLQQVNAIHQVKLSQAIKIQQASGTQTSASGGAVRGVIMDGQQFKLVGGKHLLARLCRPAQPP